MASSDLVIAKRFACAFMPDLDAARCPAVLTKAVVKWQPAILHAAPRSKRGCNFPDRTA